MSKVLIEFYSWPRCKPVFVEDIMKTMIILLLYLRRCEYISD